MKRLRLILTALAAAVLGAACGKSPEAGGKTVIRYLSKSDVGGYSKLIIEKFEKENPDIKIERMEGPSAANTREDMYATSFMAREDTYDLVDMDVIWVPKFASRGWVRPLDDFFTPEMQEKFLAGPLDGSRYKGKIYRVPHQADGGLLYYRKDLLSAAGIEPPRTWKELVAAAKKLQSPPERWGFVFQGKQYEGLVCVFLELLWGNGGDVIDGQGRVVLDSPQAVEALRWLVDAVRKDKISPEGSLTFEEEEARRLFQDGRAVFMRNWPYAWELAQQEGSAVKGKVGMVPMVGSQGRNASTLGGWGFGISSFSKHPEQAWKFIQFFDTHESQKAAYLMGGILPTRKSVFDDPEILKASPQIKDLRAVLSRTRPRPTVPAYARVSDSIQLHVSAALSGQEQPQAALSAAAAEIREVVARAR